MLAGLAPDDAKAYSPDVQDLTPQAGATAEDVAPGPPFRRQSATGAEQERRVAWGVEHAAKVREAVKQAMKGS